MAGHRLHSGKSETLNEPRRKQPDEAAVMDVLSL